MNKSFSAIKNLRVAPRKVRFFSEPFIGLPVSLAIARMKFSVHAAAKPILKAVNSASANAVNNLKLSVNNLFIDNIVVDEGSSMKRMAKGRKATTDRGLVKKRFSHVKVFLTEKGAKNG